MGAPDDARERQLDEIAQALPARVAELAHLFLQRADPAVSRADVSVMRRLALRPHRVTELAGEEQITQPGMTLLVNRMEERGWATRAPDPSDGRAVLVTLTRAGLRELQTLEQGYHAMLAAHMAALDDGEVQSLAHAVQVLDDLIAHLKE
jgi:DNA-binding MarR family transcriptional regulator